MLLSHSFLSRKNPDTFNFWHTPWANFIPPTLPLLITALPNTCFIFSLYMWYVGGQAGSFPPFPYASPSPGQPEGENRTKLRHSLFCTKGFRCHLSCDGHLLPGAELLSSKNEAVTKPVRGDHLEKKARS